VPTLRALFREGRRRVPKTEDRLPRTITKDRAERIARSHACTHCLEYSFKKLTVRPAPQSHRAELKAVWQVHRVCGVCGLEQELGLDAEGDIIYIG
jgi:hypothetical protein